MSSQVRSISFPTRGQPGTGDELLPGLRKMTESSHVLGLSLEYIHHHFMLLSEEDDFKIQRSLNNFN